MAFLEVVTRTYKRPSMLAINQESLTQQTDGDYFQTLLIDDEGRGVAWANEQLATYTPRPDSEYIWILDDDDKCIHDTLIAELKEIAAETTPDVIMMKMDHDELGILPDDGHWHRTPRYGYIGMSAFVVKPQVWTNHSHAFATNEGGDFSFISSVFQADYLIYWHDVVASQVQRISKGAPE
jgi:hypothetical protein